MRTTFCHPVTRRTLGGAIPRTAILFKTILLGTMLGTVPGIGLPLFAHHSFSAEFDDKQPVTLEGTVVKFDFMNPHSWISMDVVDASGKTVRWSVETGSTNALFRRGWRKDSLRPGDHVSIEAYRAKDGSNTANANSVKLPDGRLVSAASSRESGAK